MKVNHSCHKTSTFHLQTESKLLWAMNRHVVLMLSVTWPRLTADWWHYWKKFTSLADMMWSSRWVSHYHLNAVQTLSHIQCQLIISQTGNETVQHLQLQVDVGRDNKSDSCVQDQQHHLLCHSADRSLHQPSFATVGHEDQANNKKWWDTLTTFWSREAMKHVLRPSVQWNSRCQQHSDTVSWQRDDEGWQDKLTHWPLTADWQHLKLNSIQKLESLADVDMLSQPINVTMKMNPQSCQARVICATHSLWLVIAWFWWNYPGKVPPKLVKFKLGDHIKHFASGWPDLSLVAFFYF